MGEITRNLTPKQFYRIDGQDCCLKKNIKGGGSEKIDGLKGYLEDIKLRKSKSPEETESHFQWLFTFTDDANPQETDTRYIVQCKEGTYLSERIANLFAGIKAPGEISMSVYSSDKIKRSPGVSIKVDGIAAEFKYGEWDEVNKGYVGIPKGKPSDENRLSFVRDMIFQDTFKALLGREWDGIIEIDSSIQQAAAAEAQAVKFSVKGELAESKALEKLNSKTATEIITQWATIVKWVKGEMTFPQDAALLDQFVVMTNRVLLEKGIHDQTLKDDGTVEMDDLPF